MNKEDHFNVQNEVSEEDEISLIEILKPLWQSRWVISLMAVSAATLGLFVSLGAARYESEGFFQFGRAIPWVDYKRYSVTYVSKERFADFVQGNKLPMSDDIGALKSFVASREEMDRMVVPIYPLTKQEAKAVIAQGKSDSNDIIGMSIKYSDSKPEKAQQMVGLLGRYVMDSIVYLDYSDKIRLKSDAVKQEKFKLDSAIIVQNEELEKYRRKAVDLKQIVGRYPESAKQAAAQVISVTEDSARYLSPITLLATTEVQASEAREAIHKIKRKQQQNALRLEYYGHIEELLSRKKSGEAIILGLEPIKESLFKSKNLEDEVVREVYNEVTIENQDALNLYLKNSRFISGPTLPFSMQWRPLKALGMGLVLGLFLAVLWVFARDWWRNNKLKISG